MQSFKKLNILLILKFFFITISAIQHSAESAHTHLCGNIPIQTPFLRSNSSKPPVQNSMIICKSQKLYFRTSIGLFPVSSVDYTTKTLTISHSSCSPSRRYISPALLSAGLPPPPHPNALLLFNCSNKRNPLSPYIRNCTRLHQCGSASDQIKEQKVKVPNSCLIVQDIEKLEMGFHPNELGCSDFRRVHRRSLIDVDEYEGVELGTRISFDIPDHVPDMCKECEKPNGNCGVGLRCICHPKECKDKVISGVGSMNSGGSFLFSFVSLLIVIEMNI
ncbi:hypothetical protein SLE2022_004680 [Rubroshorea leprosula]